MAIQYYMRGYNIGTPGAVGYVDWVVNDVPDSLATFVPSPYISSNITNITVNRSVTSKVDNFLKPFESLAAIGGSGSDGYFFHLNSYDWLHATPPGPPIPVPSYLTGLSVVRGSSNGITPRDYATLFWIENELKWLFAYNTNGDGYTIGTALPVGMGSLSIDEYIEVGTNPAQSGIIRIPNNQFLVSRNAANTDDGYLIGQDNFNRIRLGSPSGNQVYIPNNLRVDGYIRDGSSSALSGFIRNSNATPIITFRNLLDTTDITALSSTSGNLINLGDAVNSGIRFNTATGFEHIFQVNSSNLLRIGNIGGINYINFEDTVLNPTVSQFTKSVGNGQNLTLKAQDTTSGASIGGSIIISSGHGLSSDGYVDLRVNNVPKIRIFGSTVPVTPDFSNNSGSNPNSIQLINNTVRWYDTISNPTITQDGYAGNNSIGKTLTIQSQNTTGTNTIGGDLNITSGQGTLADGYVRLQTGGVTKLLIDSSNDKIVIGEIGDTTYIPGTLFIGTFNTSTDLLVEDRLIHANFNEAVVGPPVAPPSLITGLTVHRGDDGSLNYNDEAGLIWVDGALLNASDGYWKAATVSAGDDFNLLTSLNMMSNSLSITSSPNPAAGTLPTVGGLRTLNNSTSVSSRNVAGTQNLLLLGTDGSDRIIHGSLALNKGHIFDTAVDGYYDFRINSVPTASIINNKFVFNKGRRRNINTVTTTITIPDGYDYIAIDASSIYTITLPSSPTLGDTYEFKDVNGTVATNNITIAGNGKNIDGISTLIMNTNFTSLIVTYTGTQWSIS